MSQDVRIKKKFIGNDAVDGEKILILNNQAVRAKKVDGSAAELYKLTDADKLRFLISPKFSNAPIEADDLSNKQYVDSEISFEEARALAAEASILSDLAVEIAARQAADVTEAAERQAADAAEAAAREAADAAEAAAREAADYFEQQARISEDSLIRQEFAAADAAEAAARQAADAAVLQEAKSYTDQEVAEEAALRAAEDMTFLKHDGSRAMTGTLEMGGNDITGIDEVVGFSGASIKVGSELAMQSHKITGLADPTLAQDAATKNYVDMQVSEGITDMLGQPSGIATLDASGKVPVTQLPNSIMQYQGMWDASTNSPMLSNSGNAPEDLGDVYRVSVAGSVDFGSGLISFSEGDYAVLGAMGWEKSDGTDQVLSVNGQQGAVVLNTSHVSEFGDYRYYTSARQAAIEAMVDAEEARAIAREAELQAEIDFEAAARAAADSAETAARIAEDVRLQSEIDAEIAARQFADSELAEDIAAEAAARQAADYAIDARLDIIEGDSTTEGSIAKAEADAKAYTDMEIAELLGDASQEYNTLGKIEDKIQFIMSNVDPAAIDSLTELLAAYQAADSNIYASVSALVDAEEAARIAEDARIEAKVDAIQAVAPRKYTLTAQDIANQYIELPESAIMPHSVIANVDRLYLLPEELVQSTVSGKVRLTFAGAIASGGDQALVTDDVLTVRYWVRS